MSGHAHSGAGSARKTNENRLDVATIHKLRDLHLHSHWPSLCRRMMIDELMQQDPRFEINGREFATHEVSPLYQELIRKYYMAFFLDAYDEIMLAGVVFLRIIKAPSGDRVPLVLSSAHFGTTYDVFVHHEGEKNLYRVVKLRNKNGETITPKTIRDVIPVDHFGVAPSADGRLNSRLLSLLDSEIFYQHLVRMTLQAEYTLSNPPLVTETRPDAPTSVPMDERRDSYYQDDEYNDELQRGIYSRDQSSWRQVRDHFEMAYQFMGKPVVNAELGRFTNPLENNVRPLPYGHSIASQALPSRNPNLPELLREYELKVSATYGIPRALVVQDVSLRTAGAFDLVQAALRSTLTYWNNIGGQLLTAVYRCIYYPEDCNWIAQVLPERGNGMTEAELYETASQIADVKILIPLGPHGTIESNRVLYEEGVITWDEYVMSARATNGFGALMMPEPPRDTGEEKEAEPKKKKRKTESKASELT
jgi:hypothetical protein